jgi:type III secretion protein L
MTFLLLHADAAGTLLADDPVVSAEAVTPLRDALALLDAAGAARARASEASAAESAIAHDAGRAAGEAQGLAEAQATIGAELLRLAEEAAAREAAQRGDVVRLALAVVRRIAGDLGPDLVAGLAEQAAAALAEESQATVRVHPSAQDAVATRLASHRRLRVEADPALSETECVIDTPLGRTIAGLEAQLTQIEQALQPGGGAGAAH